MTFRRTIIATVACGIAVAFSADAAELAVTRGTIHWGNNDKLPGNLLRSSDTEIQWQSAIFPTALTLDSQVVKRIEFTPDPSLAKTKEPLSILLRSHEVLYGSLVGIEQGHLLVSSARHGQVRIPSAAVRRIRRLDNPSVRFDGPLQLAGWRTISRARRVDEWSETAEGQLTTSSMGAELFRDLELPAVSEIQLSLTWTKKPGFLITFATPNALRLSKEAVRLETWDDELVLQTLAANGDFAQIKTLSKDMTKIDLRLLWNQESGELSVYSEYGERLGSMATGRGTTNDHSGFYIRNKGSDLKLAALRVGSWGGGLPDQQQPNQTALYLVEGDPVFGQLAGFDRASSTFGVIDAAGQSRSIPLDQIGSIDFGPREDWAKVEARAQLSYNDGTLLRGALQAVEGHTATFIPGFASQPVRCDLTGAREIRFFNVSTAEQQGEPDVLEYRDVQVRGRLAPAGADGKQLGWLAVGSKQPVALASDEYIRVVRPVKKPSRDVEPDAKSDMVYLTNGDVFPCRILVINGEEIELEVGMGDVSSIPTKHVKAVELNTKSRASVNGFDKEEWTVKSRGEKTITLTSKEAIFRTAGSIGHPNLMWANQIEFDVSWSHTLPAGLSINLFADAPQGASLTSLLLYFAGDQIYVRGFQPGPNHFQQVAGAPQFRSQRARIKLVWTAKEVRLLFNDREAWRQQMTKNSRSGRALVFTAQQFGGGDPTQKNAPLLTMSNLAVHQTSGIGIAAALHDQNRDYVLTVPRNRKKNPPQHLLIAQNGDVARGHLLALTDQQVQFRSRLDDIRLPRDRLSGIVWLEQKEDSSESLDLDQRLARATFVNSQRFTFVPDKMMGNSIHGRHPVLGACTLPVAAVRSLEVGRLNVKPQPTAFDAWKLEPAIEPKFAEAGGQGAEASGGPGTGSSLVGADAPEFEALTLGGKERFKLADHQGKTVVIDFWATWCPPCVKGLPELVELLSGYPNEKIVLITVNMQEATDTVQEFLDARELDLRVVLDTNGDISRKYQVESIPQTVIVSPDGKIARLYVGQSAKMKEDLRSVLDTLVK
jgi:thiol-disulfide isomerase/thioredoxin